MSVTRILPPAHPEAWISESVQENPCYFCAGRLTAPFVLWMGVGDALALHPACVVELCIRLLRDVHEVECTTHSYITSRTLPELRDRLRREEGLA